MRKVIQGSLAAAAWSLVFASPALAQGGLPTPQIQRSPQAAPLIYDEQVRQLDYNGRFVLDLEGVNLGPDDTAHPGGYRGGYVHLWVRRVSSGNQAGPWRKCDDNADCFVYGSTSKNRIHLGIGPGFIAESGSHLQFKVWTSLGPTGAEDPTRSDSMASNWSPVFTVDRALAGVAKPPPPKVPPVITRMTPQTFEIAPGQTRDWTLYVYGRNVCGPDFFALFNGDEANRAVPQTCSYIDADGTRLPDGIFLMRVTVPEAYRRVGTWQVTLRTREGDSAPTPLVIKGIKMTPLPDRGVVPGPAMQQVKPVIIRPPRPN
jgi:hypothetical protein